MTARVVGDIVTVRGFGFAGIEGAVVGTADEARRAIHQFLDDADVGIVLVAQSIADQLGGEFDAYKLRRELPLVLNIPDSTGAGMEAGDIQEMLQKALGLNL
jgi:V/A-type H+-transporting ATPase subunit F